ncbi:MAG TPA: ABC transporter permease [Bauldia sp.]|nr:ABC transporter permease [Bauldia sp.]
MSVHEASAAKRRTPVSRRVQMVMPSVLLAAMLVTFLVLPQFSNREPSIFNVYNAFQLWAAYGLVALGVGLTMIAREFDFGVLGVFAFCPMIAVKLGEYDTLLGFVVAIAVAAAVGFLQGFLVARLRLHSMPVTLGFYIALLGATITISNSQSVSFSNLDLGFALDADMFEILSWRSIIAIAVFALVFLVMRYTPLGRDIRAIGGDRRASRMVGVEVDRVLIIVFMTSAVCSALGGVLLAYSFATALSDPGLTPLKFAVTAAILGGVSLVGGIGSVVGIAIGALTLSLLQELFSILAAPTYVSSLVTGALLVLATIVAAPGLAARYKSFRSPRAGSTGAVAAPSRRLPDTSQ